MHSYRCDCRPARQTLDSSMIREIDLVRNWYNAEISIHIWIFIYLRLYSHRLGIVYINESIVSYSLLGDDITEYHAYVFKRDYYLHEYWRVHISLCIRNCVCLFIYESMPEKIFSQ